MKKTKNNFYFLTNTKTFQTIKEKIHKFKRMHHKISVEKTIRLDTIYWQKHTVFKLQTEVQCRFSESRKHNQSLTIIKGKKTFFPKKEKKTVKISHVIRIASKSNLQIQGNVNELWILVFWRTEYKKSFKN